MSIHAIVDYLNDIGDVNVPTPADDDILYWDETAGKWQDIAHLGVADAHHARYTNAEVLLVAAALVHAARHQNGGADEISVAGLSGLLADDQHVLDAEVLLVAAALVHAARHENGGADEISLAGLAGESVTPQPPKAHTLASHSTKAHAELTGVGTDDHHAEAHNLASHTTKAHAELTGVTAAQHHAKYTPGEAVLAVEAAGLALASGKNIKVIQALAVNFTESGLTAIMTAGTELTFSQAVYVGGDSKMEKALATGAATMPAGRQPGALIIQQH